MSRAQGYRKFLELFADSSGITGLSLAAHSMHVVEMVIWLLLVVAGTILSSLQGQRIIKAYLDEECYTKASMLDTRELKFSKIVLCIEYDVEVMRSVFDGEDPAKIRASMMGIKIGNLIENWRNAPMDIDRLWLQKMPKGELDFLYGSAKFLSMIVRSEIMQAPEVPYSKLGMQALREIYASENISLAKLQNTIGTLFCKMMNVSAGFSSANTHVFHDNLCRSSKLSWMGFPPFTISTKDSLCVLDSVLYQGIPSALQVYFNAERLYLPGANPDPRLLAFFDYGGVDVHTDRSFNVIYAQLDRCTYAELSVSDQFLVYNRPLFPCGDRPRMTCMLECLADGFFARYKCSPLAFRSPRVETARECARIFESFLSYSNQSNATWKDPEVVRCMDRCPIWCKQQILTFAPVGSCRMSMFTVFANSSTSIVVALQRLAFTQFEEVVMLDLFGLASNIGGFVGLWLGASILTICHIGSFPLKLCALKYLENRYKKVHPRKFSQPHDAFPSTMSKNEERLAVFDERVQALERRVLEMSEMYGSKFEELNEEQNFFL